jgi:hypothetical protein
MSEKCGSTDTADGEPCELPATRPDDRCHHHTEHEDEQAKPGRDRLLDDERKQQIIYTAVNSGLTVSDQANLAQVCPDTLRRALCCVEAPHNPELTTGDPCQFCEGYAQAHARGAMEVLDECRPEFRAASTFGYVKTEKREVEGDHKHEYDATEQYINLVGAASAIENTDSDE